MKPIRPREFYISINIDKKNIEYRMVKGIPVKVSGVFVKQDLFAYKNTQYKKWVITEGKTGQALTDQSTHKTMQEAIDALITRYDVIKQSADPDKQANTHIEQHIQKYGISPRYKERDYDTA